MLSTVKCQMKLPNRIHIPEADDHVCTRVDCILICHHKQLLFDPNLSWYGLFTILRHVFSRIEHSFSQHGPAQAAMSKQSAVKIPEVKYPVYYPHMRDASSAKSRPSWRSIYFYVYAILYMPEPTPV